jgi:YbgC/YbaW family acyl-CoA thioester hydrolase
MFSIPIEVDASWLSPLYDHVHHGRILSLFELSRAALAESIGFPNEQLMQAGKVLVVTRVEVDYKREVRLGIFEVTCDSVSMDGRTMRIRQRVINKNQKVAVEAQVSLMFMDAVARRGMAIPEDFAQALTERLA